MQLIYPARPVESSRPVCRDLVSGQYNFIFDFRFTVFDWKFIARLPAATKKEGGLSCGIIQD